MKARAAFLIFLGLGLGGASSASAQQTNPHPCPASINPALPCMTIQIFNDDPDNSIYPVITVGKKDKV